MFQAHVKMDFYFFFLIMLHIIYPNENAKNYCLLIIENNSLKYLLYAKENMETSITLAINKMIGVNLCLIELIAHN